MVMRKTMSVHELTGTQHCIITIHVPNNVYVCYSSFLGQYLGNLTS